MLSSAGLLVCGASLFASTGNSWQLTGKGYESDARLPALLARANEALGRALERVQGELGWKARQPPIRWAFDVSLLPEPTEATPGGEKKFFDAGSTAFLREGFVQVTLPGRKYLHHPEGVDHVIEHEAVHAVLASCLGTRERYSAVPRWFREGIALFFSGEGKTRLEEELAYAVFQNRSRDSFLAGIPSAALVGGAEVSYPEAYLALVWIEKRLPTPAFKSFLQDVARGNDFQTSLEAALGLRSDAFRAEALSFARKEIESLLPASDEALFRGANTAAWTLLLKESPQGPLGATIHYLLAKEALRRAGLAPVEEAKKHLGALFHSPQALWRPEALLLLGECFEREGKGAEAKEAWQEVSEAFGEDSASASKAREKLGSAHFSGKK